MFTSISTEDEMRSFHTWVQHILEDREVPFAGELLARSHIVKSLVVRISSFREDEKVDRTPFLFHTIKHSLHRLRVLFKVSFHQKIVMEQERRACEGEWEEGVRGEGKVGGGNR